MLFYHIISYHITSYHSISYYVRQVVPPGYCSCGWGCGDIQDSLPICMYVCMYVCIHIYIYIYIYIYKQLYYVIEIEMTAQIFVEHSVLGFCLGKLDMDLFALYVLEYFKWRFSRRKKNMKWAGPSTPVDVIVSSDPVAAEALGRMSREWPLLRRNA